MEAIIKDLEYKYYGTDIEILTGPLKGMVINLWYGTGNPSDRELAQYDENRKSWNENRLLKNNNGGESTLRESLEITCDGHYESQEVWEIAQAIVKCLKRLKV